jgi:hypothetical protein
MGSRTTWAVKTEEGDAVVWLYSHWGGDDKLATTKNALAKAEPRWNDVSYGARIFISQVIGEYWDSETGYGITTGSIHECPFEESYDYVTVDFTTNTISYGKFDFSFESFLADVWGTTTTTGKTTFDPNYQNRANIQLAKESSDS